MIGKDKLYYHGTTRRDGEDIVTNGIDIRKCSYHTDFGKGFYITSHLAEAEKRAIRKSQDHIGLYIIEEIKPVVVSFELEMKMSRVLNGLVFEEPSLEWAKFILENRKKRLQKTRSHNFDFVTGPMADGKIITLLRRVETGRMTLEEFLAAIQPYSFTQSQLSLNTNISLQYIRKLGVKEIERQ